MAEAIGQSLQTSSRLTICCNIPDAPRREGPQGAGLPAHKGTVVALSVDASNRSLVTAGLDGVLRIWDFRKQKLTGACACRASPLLQSEQSSSKNDPLTGAHATDADT